MGRWAQRRRTGGGMSLNFMTDAVQFDVDKATATYLAPINAAFFTGTEFFTAPSNQTSTSVVQQTANKLTVDFPLEISDDDTLTYTGTVASVLNPQTIAYS